MGGQGASAVAGALDDQPRLGGQGGGDQAVQPPALARQHRLVHDLAQQLVTEAVPRLARVEDEDLTIDDLGQVSVEALGVEQADGLEQLGVGDRPGRRHDPQQTAGTRPAGGRRGA
jgi:hypothetical protein